VTWTVSPDEKVVGYDVLRAGPDSDSFTVVATVNGRETAGYVDKGGAKPNALGRLADGTEYRYQVVAFNTARAGSKPSEIAKAKSKFAPMAPIEPEATTNLPKSAVITWSPNAEMDISQYVVESAAAGTTKFREITRVPVSQDERITATETKLPDGVGRVYRVKAIDKDTLESPWSDTVEGATKPLPPPPADAKAELNDQGALLTWTPSPVPDIKQYKIWKKGFIGADLLTATESSEYQLSSMDVGKKLVVVVSAVDLDGLESERTAPVEIRPPAVAQ
jgi:fibronectin type 3 domain-containing protein